MIKYIQRMRDLQFLIINAEWRQYGNVSNNKFKEINDLITKAFCYGLSTKYKTCLGIKLDHRSILTHDGFSKIRKTGLGERERERSSRETVVNGYINNYTGDSSTQYANVNKTEAPYQL